MVLHRHAMLQAIIRTMSCIFGSKCERTRRVVEMLGEPCSCVYDRAIQMWSQKQGSLSILITRESASYPLELEISIFPHSVRPFRRTERLQVAHIFDPILLASSFAVKNLVVRRRSSTTLEQSYHHITCFVHLLSFILSLPCC